MQPFFLAWTYFAVRRCIDAMSRWYIENISSSQSRRWFQNGIATLTLGWFHSFLLCRTLLLKNYLNSYTLWKIQAEQKKITGACKSAVANIEHTHPHIYAPHWQFPPRLNALPVRCPGKNWAPCNLHMYHSCEHGKKLCGPYTQYSCGRDDVKKDNDKKEGRWRGLRMICKATFLAHVVA